MHRDADRGNSAESLAPPRPSGEAVLSADAAQCSPFTDAGLTRSERSLSPSIAAIPDDRLLTVADVCALLQIRKSVVYAACDHGDLAYVKFEGAVQIEGRDLKHWIVSVPSKPLGPA